MKRWLCCLPVVAAGLSGMASAQSSFMPDVIGQAVAGYGGGPSDACFDGTWTPKPKGIAKASIRADKAFEEYRALAAAKGNLKPIIYGKQSWVLDGAARDPVAAVDPWAGRIAKVERTNLTVGNTGSYRFRGVWKAYAADGSLLGTYDALMQAGRGSAGFMQLDLYSPGAADKMPPFAPFCGWPGDVERWKAAKAQYEAEKAAKRAAKAGGAN